MRGESGYFFTPSGIIVLNTPTLELYMALSGVFFRGDFGCAWAFTEEVSLLPMAFYVWLQEQGVFSSGFVVLAWLYGCNKSLGRETPAVFSLQKDREFQLHMKKRVSFFIGTNCPELSTKFLAGLAFTQAMLCSVCFSKYLGVVLIPSSICRALLGGVGVCWPEKQSDKKRDLAGQRAEVVQTVNTSLYLYLYPASWVMSVRRGKPASLHSEMQLPRFIAPSYQTLRLFLGRWGQRLNKDVPIGAVKDGSDLRATV